MSQTKKVRDVRHSGRAALVVVDVLPPWQPRMIEIRGTAEVVPDGGKASRDNFEDTIVSVAAGIRGRDHTGITHRLPVSIPVNVPGATCLLA